MKLAFLKIAAIFLASVITSVGVTGKIIYAGESIVNTTYEGR